jgi:hypothetical protein
MDKEVYADIQRMSEELWDAGKTSLIMDEVSPGNILKYLIHGLAEKMDTIWCLTC